MVAKSPEEGKKLKYGKKVTLVSRGPDGIREDKIAFDDLSARGPVVVFFYPKDNTSGCTTEAIGFRDLKKSHPNLNVVGVSKDNAKSHASFLTNQELNFPLISDEDDLCEFFGVWAEKSMYGKKFMGIVRSTFILEKGIVLKAYPKVSPAKHPAEVEAFLKSVDKL